MRSVLAGSDAVRPAWMGKRGGEILFGKNASLGGIHSMLLTRDTSLTFFRLGGGEGAFFRGRVVLDEEMKAFSRA